MESLVIVEGASDRAALETLAERRGRDLAAEGVEVVAIGGAQAISAFLRRVGREVRIAGLCDAGEEGAFRRGLERAGLGPVVDRGALEKLGFYVCEPDLEGELIRALGRPVWRRYSRGAGSSRRSARSRSSRSGGAARSKLNSAASSAAARARSGMRRSWSRRSTSRACRRRSTACSATWVRRYA
jgi:hypothetical protein